MENVVQEKVHSTENDSNLKFKVQVFDKISSIGLDSFSLEQFDISSDLNRPDAYLLRSHSLHDVTFPETLKVIGRAGAGVNNIPLDKSTLSGVVVFNTPGANANAVKELVIAGLLLSSRDIVGGIEYVNSIKDKGDDIPQLVEKNKSRFKGGEITGKTLGVIGLGAIGLQVANAGLSLGLNVKGYDPFISVDSAWELSSNVEKASSLEKLIKDSDFITVHIPFNDKTKGFINADRIRMMNKGTVLLNFSRNSLVDESEMITALNEQRVARYVTDFPNPLLVDNDRVISIPHLGASTKEAEDNCAIMVSNQVKNFLRDGTIVNSVNFPSCQLERGTDYRITVINTNVPSVIGKITSMIADASLNIIEMVNRSRGDIAYNIIDVDALPNKEVINQLMTIDGVINVRYLPKT